MGAVRRHRLTLFLESPPVRRVTRSLLGLVIVGAVIHAHRDHPQRARYQFVGPCPLVAVLRHIRHVAVLAKLTELGEKLDRLYEIVGIPRDTEVPTLAEQLNAAQSDAAIRKQIQSLFAELEFENTEVDFN